ncbi:MAG: hypothetical protein GX568_00145 [Candidatus Gastranaerophilales bacterium]|nr:hypothetical protein [Candidatus Gastranaerophilales bacterium]
MSLQDGACCDESVWQTFIRRIMKELRHPELVSGSNKLYMPIEEELKRKLQNERKHIELLRNAEDKNYEILK